MESICGTELSVPIQTHDWCATTPTGIDALFQQIEVGDYIRYNDRKMPVEVIEATADTITVVGQRSQQILERYDGRKYTVRVRYENSQDPITELAIITKEGRDTYWTKEEYQQQLQKGVMWTATYQEYDDEADETTTVCLLTTQLKYTDSKVVTFYNHLSDDNPVYTTPDTVIDVTTLVPRGSFPEKLQEGDRITVTVYDGVGDQTVFDARVLDDREGKHGMSYRVKTQSDEYYTISRGNSCELLFQNMLSPNPCICGVVQSIRVQ